MKGRMKEKNERKGDKKSEQGRMRMEGERERERERED